MTTIATTRGKTIIGLQRRVAQVGRIRLGERRRTNDNRPYPAKLEKFRLTSKDPVRLEAAAEHYGGTVRPWDDPSTDDRYELYTDVDSLDIAVIPGQALTQSMELWGQEHPKGTKPNPVICLRRCDGQTCQIPNPKPKSRGWIDVQCPCAELDEPECKPATRISVLLTKIPGFGVWRLDTKGWNAGAELAGTVALLEAMTAAANLPVRARLRVEIVTEVKRRGTFKYAKPVLDIDQTPDQIVALAAGTPAGPAAALETPHFTPIGELPAGDYGSIEDQVAGVGAPGPVSKRANASEPMRPTGLAPRPASEVDAPAPDVGADDAPEAGDSSPAAADGGHPSSAPVDPQKSRTQRVARWCRDAGLDDDGRHHFLAAFSGGEYASAREVPDDHMPRIRRDLIALQRGDLELVDVDGTWKLRETALGDHPGIDWSAEVGRTPGIGEARFLSTAKRIANDKLDADTANGIKSYDTVPAAITADLLSWIAERRDEGARS